MDEQQKQRLMLAVVAFNMTVIAACVVLWWIGAFRGQEFWTAFWLTVAVSAPIGVVVGGLVYFVTGMSP